MRRILYLAAVAAIALLAVPPVSSAQPYSPYQYGQYAAQDYITGRVGAFQPYNLWLGGNNGLHVTMHDGTVINPTGTTLQPGMRVRIWGYWNDNGTFEANQIDVGPPGSSVYSYPVQPYAPSAYVRASYDVPSTYPDYMTGTVSAFQPYNVWLGRGSNSLHVTMHDGTVINPTGITLQPNMRVRIWGQWNGNGTFEANQIDVVNASAFDY